MHPIKVNNVRLELIWFDSMGAKSSSIFVETPDIKLLVDPGAAGMQPSYPLSSFEKEKLRKKALSAIRERSKDATHIFISHYHYDHHTLPSRAKDIYAEKILWIKDPNRWINKSQWERARLFLHELYNTFKGEDSSPILISPKQFNVHDPIDELPLAMSKDYGDYSDRKKELLSKGRKWFTNMVDIWTHNQWVPEFKVGELEVNFVDGKQFKIGNTKIRFTKPLFHGIEYDRVGWVIALILEYGDTKILYTSDLQGPMIEDYAEWIIRENPDLLIADGPPTYLLGYMLNQINLRRATSNIVRIINETNTKLIIYDHHLLREKLFRRRMQRAYDEASKQGKNFVTAAEWLGDEPLILKLTRGA